MLERRAEVTRKFISGEWGVELDGFEASEDKDRQKSADRANAWRK